MNAAHQLTLFEQRLPKKPYYSDNLSNGLSIIAAKKAVKSRYIQHNGPTHKYWLVFDVDRLGATMCWEDSGAPAPNIVATNRENGHAHLIYGLEIPIRTAPDGSSKALRYAAAVEAA
ncbi:replication initiation protein, partial [Shewanella morhuae]|uniref:replication initiation protein n=2 Tax=Shewanella TaxID=22 RepID=UPI001C7D9C73